ncbi:hypothetical protein C7B77_16115 [Chamaesiphon polymorphus CCALA 037]|uniref:Uncharacterized protein n=1 Tax=Chamaesiphon polymorphus CCALA 037 TaxID=2107692 RepID=A0A2T1GCK0_9CYAN|nr:hypothetical protein C7B77_16115 [Chamaesiphon polymorphus CCALA 037]
MQGLRQDIYLIVPAEVVIEQIILDFLQLDSNFSSWLSIDRSILATHSRSRGIKLPALAS